MFEVLAGSLTAQQQLSQFAGSLHERFPARMISRSEKVRERAMSKVWQPRQTRDQGLYPCMAMADHIRIVPADDGEQGGVAECKALEYPRTQSNRAAPEIQHAAPHDACMRAVEVGELFGFVSQ